MLSPRAFPKSRFVHLSICPLSSPRGPPSPGCSTVGGPELRKPSANRENVLLLPTRKPRSDRTSLTLPKLREVGSDTEFALSVAGPARVRPPNPPQGLRCREARGARLTWGWVSCGVRAWPRTCGVGERQRSPQPSPLGGGGAAREVSQADRRGAALRAGRTGNPGDSTGAGAPRGLRPRCPSASQALLPAR